jgi:hypothetical protein
LEPEPGQKTGLDLTQPDGLETSTSWRQPLTCSPQQASQRQARLKIDVDQIRSVNPRIIYARERDGGAGRR